MASLTLQHTPRGLLHAGSERGAKETGTGPQPMGNTPARGLEGQQHTQVTVMRRRGSFGSLARAQSACLVSGGPGGTAGVQQLGV